MKPLSSLLGFVIGLFSVSLACAEMTVHFIDVGQGGGVLIEKDGKTILYDCGDTFASEAVVEYLTTFDISVIDAMIISHAHKDHMGGCIDVLDKFAVTTLYHNGSKANTKIWTKFLKNVTASQIQTVVVDKDIEMDGLRILVAYDAPRNKRFSKEADNSLLVHLTDGTVRVLLTGDCEKACEKEIIKTTTVSSQILNVGHHGSDAASSPDFLASVKPKIAIAQAGVNNQYDHPTPAVRKRLQKKNIHLYRTDYDGSIMVRSDGNGYEVETDK